MVFLGKTITTKHLHCVSWPHPNTGRSPVRPIAVVVYLIRPNGGLTAVLLGKSTTTTALAQRARGSRETLFFFSFYLFISFNYFLFIYLFHLINQLNSISLLTSL